MLLIIQTTVKSLIKGYGYSNGTVVEAWQTVASSHHAGRQAKKCGTAEATTWRKWGRLVDGSSGPCCWSIALILTEGQPPHAIQAGQYRNLPLRNYTIPKSNHRSIPKTHMIEKGPICLAWNSPNFPDPNCLIYICRNESSVVHYMSSLLLKMRVI